MCAQVLKSGVNSSKIFSVLCIIRVCGPLIFLSLVRPTVGLRDGFGPETISALSLGPVVYIRGVRALVLGIKEGFCEDARLKIDNKAVISNDVIDFTTIAGDDNDMSLQPIIGDVSAIAEDVNDIGVTLGDS